MAHTDGTITRRKFAKTAVGGLALAALGVSRAGRAQAARPNIVFIMADDLGYADLGCYGQSDYTTLNIDCLAIEGMRFTQGYANSAVCSATRAALITGRYQYRLVVGLEEPVTTSSPKNAGLPSSHPTLPSLVKTMGYKTALVGKWHLGFLPDFSPLKSGYDQFFGIFAGAADYFNHGPGAPAPLYEQEVPVERHGYMTNLLGDRAVQTIADYSRTKDPFFLSLHFTAPHWPWEGPGDEAESKRIKSLWHYDGGSQKIYASMVQSMDVNVGRVLEALDRHGHTGNTVVVFTSDNGGERFSKTWPFSGMKEELLEGGLRVPAIVRWPARVAAGSVSEQAMISMDWMPTLLAAAGTSADPAYPPDGEAGAAYAQAVLALQSRSAASRARRRLEVPAAGRQRLPLRCRAGSTRARESQGAAARRVPASEERLGGLERHDATGKGFAGDLPERRKRPRRSLRGSQP